MTTLSETMRLFDHYCLPEEVFDIILRKIYSWGSPKVDYKGYVVSKVKNIRECPTSMVLDVGVDIPHPNDGHLERRVCLWKSDYYEMKTQWSGFTKERITGINDWIRIEGLGWLLKDGVDRRSEEWIGYISWLHTHPSFLKETGAGGAFRGNWERENPKVLTDNWFEYELALAYPTLYGEGGWVNSS